MGLRYRKSIKVSPGVKLNLSKSGISTSVGKRGSTLNFSKRGTKATVGIPGSGLSYSKMVSKQQKASGRRSITKQEANEIRAELRGKYDLKNSEIKRMVKYSRRHPQRFRSMTDEEIIARFRGWRMPQIMKKILLILLLIALIIAFLSTFAKK